MTIGNKVLNNFSQRLRWFGGRNNAKEIKEIIEKPRKDKDSH